ncbi:hypothetical protein NE237_024837 [Protea cynaroides]|uniref:Uncharacterized protein n=1 Tax=Protea cynaroides TaxID=273540 RepID=A0A9Q0H0M9_9MAGN|nr:hypothetical protein NE237_024837 [Protea cynaroides]
MPGQGHINPMLQFCKKLHSKGLRVTLAITRSLFKTMQTQTGPIRIETFSDGYDNGFQKEDKMEDYFESVKLVGSQTLTDLIKKQESMGDPITCVLYDDLGSTAAAFFTQSCAVSIIYYYVQQGLLTVPVTAGPVNSIPGFPLLEIIDLQSFVSVYDGPHPMLLTLVINQFHNIDQADWILFNSFDKLEQETINLMAKQLPVKTIGPTVSSIYHNRQVEGNKDYSLNLFKPVADTCMNWLNMRETRSVVYVSFGSIAEVGDEKMNELASALKESNNYFMWVVRQSEEKKLPSNFPTNAKYIEDVWGIGLRVKVDENGAAVREEIQACIREVIGEKGKDIRKNAIKWKELAKEAVEGGGNSDKNIQEFVASMSCP